MINTKKIFLIFQFIMIITFIPKNFLSQEGSTGFTFYAVYDNIVDTETHNKIISSAAMSGDGTKIIFSGYDADSEIKYINTVNTDGTGITSIPYPEDLWIIMQLLINRDGSIAYVHDNSRIFKISGSSIYNIYDARDNNELSGFSQLRITADGLTIYIRKSESYQRGSIWRMDNSGGAIMKLFEYKDVIRDGGTGAGITDFDISANGEVIAFILRGYHDLEQIYHTKYEVFIKMGSAYDQLTDDGENIIKGNIKVSGNGSKIVFTSGSPHNVWYTINRDGSNKTIIDEKNFDVVGPALDYEGDKLFYRDDGTNGGRIANADGIWLCDMFSNIYNNSLGVYKGLSLSDDGRRVSFIHRSGYDYYALYYGYINEAVTTTDASQILNIGFSPSVLSKDAGAVIVATAELMDPQGITDIEFTSTEVLIGGIRKAPGSNEVPVCFFDPVNDKGLSPDLTAHDGLFCTEGEQGPSINDFSSIRVRVGAADKSKNVTIADTILYIGTSPVKVGELTAPTEFHMSQNYPNPFNPVTKIKYSIPCPSADGVNSELSIVNVKIFDVLGREVETLVNEIQKPGNYEVEFNAEDISSGVYYYKMTFGTTSIVRKMVIMK